jgi:hypothetical protein
MLTVLEPSVEVCGCGLVLALGPAQALTRFLELRTSFFWSSYQLSHFSLMDVRREHLGASIPYSLTEARVTPSGLPRYDNPHRGYAAGVPQRDPMR